MAVMLVHLSLLVITVIHLTSSQSTYDVIQQDSDVSSCGSNEQVIRHLSQLTTTISQLTTAVSALQGDVTKLKSDVTELKNGSRQKRTISKLISYKQESQLSLANPGA